MRLWKRQLTVEDNAVTSAVHLTLRQSLFPNLLGMWAEQSQEITITDNMPASYDPVCQPIEAKYYR